mmetsp:Transcript_14528/g.45655  ORF Transcript_14528/g.45655 Transcript_14528/m.45655 type:complete len:227 (+) Transcript_14528:1221-1901(+)
MRRTEQADRTQTKTMRGKSCSSSPSVCLRYTRTARTFATRRLVLSSKRTPTTTLCRLPGCGLASAKRPPAATLSRTRRATRRMPCRPTVGGVTASRRPSCGPASSVTTSRSARTCRVATFCGLVPRGFTRVPSPSRDRPSTRRKQTRGASEVASSPGPPRPRCTQRCAHRRPTLAAAPSLALSNSTLFFRATASNATWTRSFRPRSWTRCPACTGTTATRSCRALT